MQNMKTQYESATPQERVFRAVDVMSEYGIEVPVEFLDTSEEDGTAMGARRREFVEKAIDLLAEYSGQACDRLDSYHEALSGKGLSLTQDGIATLFFRSELILSLGEASLGSYDGTGKSIHPDAAADLKRAFYEGMLEEVVDTEG